MLPKYEDLDDHHHQHHGVTLGQHQAMQEVMDQMPPETRSLVESLPSVTAMEQEMAVPNVTSMESSSSSSSSSNSSQDLQLEIPESATVSSTAQETPEALQHQQRVALRSLRESHSGFSRAFLRVTSRMDELDVAYRTSIYEIYDEIDALGIELESFWIVYVSMLEKKNLLKASCDKLNGVFEMDNMEENNNNDAKSARPRQEELLPPTEEDDDNDACQEKRPYDAIDEKTQENAKDDVENRVNSKEIQAEEVQSRPAKVSRPSASTAVIVQQPRTYLHPPPEHFARPPLGQHHSTPWAAANGQYYHHYHHYHNPPAAHYYYGAAHSPHHHHHHHFPQSPAAIHMQHHAPQVIGSRPPAIAPHPLPPPPPSSSSARENGGEDDAGQHDHGEEEDGEATASSALTSRRPLLRSKVMTWERGPVCMPKQQPVPNKFQGDMISNRDLKLPEFKELCNYESKRGDNLPEDMRFCVMCGHACLFNPSKDKRSGCGNIQHLHHHHQHQQHLHHHGHNGNGGEPIIPSQNKGVCTSCDTIVWVLLRGLLNGTEIKFCKGCKNFRPWAAFGEKGLATKCSRCRERQREKYALQKEEKEFLPVMLAKQH